MAAPGGDWRPLADGSRTATTERACSEDPGIGSGAAATDLGAARDGSIAARTLADTTGTSTETSNTTEADGDPVPRTSGHRGIGAIRCRRGVRSDGTTPRSVDPAGTRPRRYLSALLSTGPGHLRRCGGLPIARAGVPANDSRGRSTSGTVILT